MDIESCTPNSIHNEEGAETQEKKKKLIGFKGKKFLRGKAWSLVLESSSLDAENTMSPKLPARLQPCAPEGTMEEASYFQWHYSTVYYRQSVLNSRIHQHLLNWHCTKDQKDNDG